MIRKLLLPAILLGLLSFNTTGYSQVAFTPSSVKNHQIGANAFVYGKQGADELRKAYNVLVNVKETPQPSSFTDGVSNGTTLFQSQTMLVTSADVGLNVVGTNIANAPGTTIASIPATTIASGSNTQTLPQATINVASTTNFADPVLATVVTSGGGQAVTCTGHTTNTLTGCTGGTGTMSTGGAVTSKNTVVLSTAATGTGTGETFSIQGRATAVPVNVFDGSEFYTKITGTGRLVQLRNGFPGCTIGLLIQQDGTGSRTVTWENSGANQVYFASGSAPTLSTGANKVDWFRAKYTGSGWLLTTEGQNY